MRQPDLRPSGPRQYTLEEDYRYYFRMNGTSCLIRIPKGFVTDGASVPRPLWGITGLRPSGRIEAAALLHDFIYRYQGRLSKGSFFTRTKGTIWLATRTKWSRKFADKLFLTVMRQSGLGKGRSYSAYLGVRLFGWMSWGGSK